MVKLVAAKTTDWLQPGVGFQLRTCLAFDLLPFHLPAVPSSNSSCRIDITTSAINCMEWYQHSK